jgi:hypothetical protein
VTSPETCDLLGELANHRVDARLAYAFADRRLLDELTRLRDEAFPPDATPSVDWYRALETLRDLLDLKIDELHRRLNL